MELESLQGRRVHFLGIGGIGVSALARLVMARGIAVSGSDVRPSSITEALAREGAAVVIGHRAENLAGVDVVVHSTAIPEDNPELAAARARGLPVLHRSELLGALVEAATTVGVTGTNGKGTVASMITWVLEVAGFDPSFYIGAHCLNLGTNARAASSRWLVAELDESDGSLVNTRPRFAVLNNLEMDHLNYYRDFDHVLEILGTFFRQLPEGAVGFFNADCDGARLVARAAPVRRVFFGEAEDADVRLTALSLEGDGSRFTVALPCFGASRFSLAVPGRYNVENALAAIAVCRTLGVPVDALREGLATYRGLANRYTVLQAGGCRVIKDYISHPTGIRKVLATATFGAAGRVRAVFKPYRYTMINYHAENYRDAFEIADEVIITEMWEADEEPIPGVSTPWLAEVVRAGGQAVVYVPEMDGILPYLQGTLTPEETVIFFGGDDLFALADELARRLGIS
ncbi:MAG: UDP-N-acetylmuramate--L-alanine ligase [Deltaproteobacteria bacterium]|nr:UDP-N-acetylmuramate--L-alanine ligase [Deltaproteobacteria bacterium]